MKFTTIICGDRIRASLFTVNHCITHCSKYTDFFVHSDFFEIYLLFWVNFWLKFILSNVIIAFMSSILSPICCNNFSVHSSFSSYFYLFAVFSSLFYALLILHLFDIFTFVLDKNVASFLLVLSGILTIIPSFSLHDFLISRKLSQFSWQDIWSGFFFIILFKTNLTKGKREIFIVFSF